jgi:hypothetical protein
MKEVNKNREGMKGEWIEMIGVNIQGEGHVIEAKAKKRST